jgi:hypothetical protein
MLIDEIKEVLTIIKKSSLAKDIEGLHCFEFTQPTEFFRVIDIIRKWDPEGIEPNGRLLAEKWENAMLTVASLDRQNYYIVCKDVPRIDTLWNEMKK